MESVLLVVLNRTCQRDINHTIINDNTPQCATWQSAGILLLDIIETVGKIRFCWKYANVIDQ